MDTDKMDKVEIGKKLQRRASSLPLSMDSIVYDTGMYLCEDIDAPEYVDRYCKNSEPLYKRIAIGEEKEVFKENYAPELEMISNIREAITGYTKKALQDLELSQSIEKLSKKYLSIKFCRKKFFRV